MNKLKGHHLSTPGKQRIFSEEEEKTSVERVISMSEFGFPIDEFDLRCIIHAYLGRIGRQVKQFKNNFPGKEWSKGFLKRNQELTVRFATNIKKSRASIDEATLTEYSNNLRDTCMQVQCENIFNYDETNLEKGAH